jgi:fatty-acyl-CoA synthase
MRGATAVMMSNFDASAAANAMARFSVAHLHGGDNLIREMLHALSFDGAALSHWRTCYFGAFTGRPAEETIALIEGSGAPHVRAAQAYGSSEGLAFIAGSAVSASLEQRARAGGALLDDATQVRVVDEAGGALQYGVAGVIQLRGATVTIGYHENPAATAAAFTADGWFKTGDLGFMTPDGVVFVARMGDALRLRGNLVDPAEIENHLCAHPGVAEAHVVGVRQAEGDVAVAFVAPVSADLTEADLIAFCRARIASFKIPARIIVTDDIPRTPGVNAAKVQKNVLRERASAYLATPFNT